MQLDEESLRVAVQAALAHLVGLNLDEGAVATLRLRRKLQCSERPGEGAGARGVCRALERKRREEIIRDAQNIGGGELCSEEMAHALLLTGGLDDGLHPIHAL